MTQPWQVPSAQDPEEALAAVVALRDLADRLESDAVAHAIAAGWSWAQVAACLGISRQAAHKRFAHMMKGDRP
jgi:hypothetical protein